MQFCVVGADGEPIAYVNRPPENKNIRHWMNYVCGVATEHRLLVMLNCDTAEQAEAAAKRAFRKLPRHRRMALERIYRPETRREPERLD
jgi:hypothetical protein